MPQDGRNQWRENAETLGKRLAPLYSALCQSGYAPDMALALLMQAAFPQDNKFDRLRREKGFIKENGGGGGC